MGDNFFLTFWGFSGEVHQVALKTTTDYTTGCLDYKYFKNYYKIIAIDLSKQQAFDVDPKAIQQFNFTGNLDQPAGDTTFYIIEETKETVLDFSQGTVKVF